MWGMYWAKVLRECIGRLCAAIVSTGVSFCRRPALALEVFEVIKAASEITGALLVVFEFSPCNESSATSRTFETYLDQSSSFFHSLRRLSKRLQFGLSLDSVWTQFRLHSSLLIRPLD